MHLFSSARTAACITGALLGVTLSIAHARCDSSQGWHTNSRDDWRGIDKAKHAVISAPFGAAGAYLARDTEHPVLYGALLGTIPGLAKEVYDGACGSGFSYKDLAADFAGSLSGAYFGNWAISYKPSQGKQVMVTYKNSY